MGMVMSARARRKSSCITSARASKGVCVGCVLMCASTGSARVSGGVGGCFVKREGSAQRRRLARLMSGEDSVADSDVSRAGLVWGCERV